MWQSTALPALSDAYLLPPRPYFWAVECARLGRAAVNSEWSPRFFKSTVKLSCAWPAWHQDRHKSNHASLGMSGEVLVVPSLFQVHIHANTASCALLTAGQLCFARGVPLLFNCEACKVCGRLTLNLPVHRVKAGSLKSKPSSLPDDTMAHAGMLVNKIYAHRVGIASCGCPLVLLVSLALARWIQRHIDREVQESHSPAALTRGLPFKEGSMEPSAVTDVVGHNKDFSLSLPESQTPTWCKPLNFSQSDCMAGHSSSRCIKYHPGRLSSKHALQYQTVSIVVLLWDGPPPPPPCPYPGGAAEPSGSERVIAIKQLHVD